MYYSTLSQRLPIGGIICRLLGANDNVVVPNFVLVVAGACNYNIVGLAIPVNHSPAMEIGNGID